MAVFGFAQTSKASYKKEIYKSKKSKTLSKKKYTITEPKETDLTLYADEANYIAKQISYAAQENIGAKYKSGGTNQNGFDCSGLVFSTFLLYDIILPRTSKEMSDYGNTVESNNAKLGDLIFFSTNNSGRVNHVGIITDILDNDIKFIHSSVHKGVIISSLNENYYKKSFIKINRILD